MPTDATSDADPTQTINAQQRRSTVVMVRWALIIACAYMVVFSESSSGTRGLGPLVIVAFLASNLVVGRLPTTLVGTSRFGFGIAVLDTLLIGASLYFAGQVSVELVVLFLGVLVLTIAGFRLGVIAALTIGLAAASLLMVGMAGSHPLLRSSMLLRVPFLLSAAMVYAWLAEVGHQKSAPPTAADTLAQLAHDLSLQLASIQRCQAAVSEGLMTVAQSVLNEIAVQNQEMLAKAGGWQPQTTEPHDAPAAARSAA